MRLVLVLMIGATLCGCDRELSDAQRQEVTEIAHQEAEAEVLNHAVEEAAADADNAVRAAIRAPSIPPKAD